MSGIGYTSGVNGSSRSGADPARIHDRFLVLDDDVWLLGCSLKTFGERGTTAVKLPYAREILDDIEDEWTRAQTLADFVADLTPSKDESL